MTIDRRTWLKTLLLSPLAAAARGQTAAAGRLAAVPLAGVTVEDAFWTPWIERTRKVTIPYLLRMAEETGVVANFLRAAGKLDGDYQGFPSNDEVLYKALEAACYALIQKPDPQLAGQVEDLAAKIAAAQEPDGYLWTLGTIRRRQGKPATGANFELYLAGHLYQAALAHHQATGKRTLLDVALKNLALLEGNLGKPTETTTRTDLELALPGLYEATGDERCLRLARFLLEGRGRAQHEPLLEQPEILGQASGMASLLAAAAEIASLEPNEPYATAAGRLWDDAVNQKMYLTGGIGSRADTEGFSSPYDLPNRTAYCETCAAVAFAHWSHRMFLLDGDPRHIDILERTLYNNLLAAVSLQGDTFSYTNPLESDAAPRRKWFDRACCPPNAARAIARMASCIYATRGSDLYVNLFVSGEAKLKTPAGTLRLRQETRYPWDGTIRITLEPERAAQFRLFVRLPGWAQGRPVPSNLYRYLDPKAEQIAVKVNERDFPYQFEKGYAVLERRWGKGDRIELNLALPVRRVVSHPSVRDNTSRVALERGPIVYCVEGADNAGRVFSLVLPDGAQARAQHRRDLLGGVTAIEGDAVENQLVRKFTAIPYYAWGSRGDGEMAVWLRRAGR
jgi:DUF1680 family protein